MLGTDADILALALVADFCCFFFLEGLLPFVDFLLFELKHLKLRQFKIKKPVCLSEVCGASFSDTGVMKLVIRKKT